MNSKVQKKLAGKITKRSPKKIKLDVSRYEEIKEAITRADIKSLIKDKAIIIESDKGVSRSRAKKASKQKVKGRRKGQGSRKGKANARLSGKEQWMARIRLQRKFLKELKEKSKITQEQYKELYRKAKGGFFRSKRHIKLYITEHNMIKK
jgi:large subunit ribosomal protein L19e